MPIFIDVKQSIILNGSHKLVLLPSMYLRKKQWWEEFACIGFLFNKKEAFNIITILPFQVQHKLYYFHFGQIFQKKKTLNVENFKNSIIVARFEPTTSSIH